MQPTQGEGPWSSADYRNGSDIESDNYVAPTSTYSGGQAWAADVAARRAGASGRQLDELLAGVGADGISVDTRPGSVYVQAGDSLSKIAARFPEYGNVNDLKNQLIAANPQLRDPNALTEGMELNFPGAGTVVDRAAMARAVGADGRYQAALAAQQPDAQEPVWSFREASMAQRKLDDARALAEYQARLANGPSMSAWDGVTRLSPAEDYLVKARGGLDAVRGDNWQFRVAQSLPDAAMNEVGGLVVGAGLKLANAGWTATRGAIYGEEALLRAELNSTLRGAGQANMPGMAALDGLSPGAPIQTYWPPKSGFYGSTNTQTLDAGYRFSRYGGFVDEGGAFNDFGNFVAPVEVPFGMRALPESSLAKPLSTYEVVKPVPDVLTGKAAPWFNQIGQGTQHQLPMPIQDLIDQGYIKLVNRTIPPKP